MLKSRRYFTNAGITEILTDARAASLVVKAKAMMPKSDMIVYWVTVLDKLKAYDRTPKDQRTNSISRRDRRRLRDHATDELAKACAEKLVGNSNNSDNSNTAQEGSQT